MEDEAEILYFSLCLWLDNGIHSSELVKLYTKKVNVTVHKFYLNIIILKDITKFSNSN